MPNCLWDGRASCQISRVWCAPGFDPMELRVDIRREYCLKNASYLASTVDHPVIFHVQGDIGLTSCLDLIGLRCHGRRSFVFIGVL